jgi:hypothetical protein
MSVLGCVSVLFRFVLFSLSLFARWAGYLPWALLLLLSSRFVALFLLCLFASSFSRWGWGFCLGLCYCGFPSICSVFALFVCVTLLRVELGGLQCLPCDLGALLMWLFRRFLWIAHFCVLLCVRVILFGCFFVWLRVFV